MESISRNGRPVADFGLGEAPACPALPSGSSAVALLSGDMSALPVAIGHTILRAGLVGSGLLIAGERAHVIRNAIAGSLAIETFVLGWAAWKLRRKQPRPKGRSFGPGIAEDSTEHARYPT
jgi:hypothetical protein